MMTVTELMAGRTPDAAFEGFLTADDWVLAVGISPEGREPGDYVAVQAGIVKVQAGLSPVTAEKQYIRAGQTTLKTGAQRVFEITGDRIVGDAFQDWALSLDMRYGTGQSVVVPYVYFCLQSGKGERGEASLLIESDALGGAGEGSSFLIRLRQAGGRPQPYAFAATPPAEP